MKSTTHTPRSVLLTLLLLQAALLHPVTKGSEEFLLVAGAGQQGENSHAGVTHKTDEGGEHKTVDGEIQASIGEAGAESGEVTQVNHIDEGKVLSANATTEGGHDSAVGAEEDERDQDENRSKFFFVKGHRTETHTIVSFTTSTVPLTCFAGIATMTAPPSNAAICNGKRKKRNIDTRNMRSETPHNLESSEGTRVSAEFELEDKKERFFFTVWKKTFTTTTLTSIVTDSATTFSLSYYCSAGNIDFPLIGC